MRRTFFPKNDSENGEGWERTLGLWVSRLTSLVRSVVTMKDKSGAGGGVLSARGGPPGPQHPLVTTTLPQRILPTTTTTTTTTTPTTSTTTTTIISVPSTINCHTNNMSSSNINNKMEDKGGNDHSSRSSVSCGSDDLGINKPNSSQIHNILKNNDGIENSGGGGGGGGHGTTTTTTSSSSSSSTTAMETSNNTLMVTNQISSLSLVNTSLHGNVVEGGPLIITRKLSANSCPFSKRPMRLRNFSNGIPELYDTLHAKQNTTLCPEQNTRCTEQVCLGSISSFTNPRPSGTARPVEEVKRLAKDFFDQYYTSIKRLNSTSHNQRWEQVIRELDENGTYELTETELVYGAKLAWRNAVRCIGRIQWAKLQVFDARSVVTSTGMFESICKHIKYATNKGNIRSAITVFPHRTDAKHDYRVWNPQLIGYAGYRNPDGTTTGDASNIEFTEVCKNLGWKSDTRTKFDILPLVLSADGHDPECYEIPRDLILEVNLTHPEYDWFTDLGLKWYSVPAVSGMLFDCGGLEFTACPFNGWYMSTEIGCRDLGDQHRYNVYEEVATKMGLDTRNPTTLWKDKAMVELNLAVLHSYQRAGVTIVDHHTAAESFMKHYENELKARGGCPADWVWIVPPMSGSATPVFHQEMVVYHLKPSYEYMEPAWKTHVWKKDVVDGQMKPPRRKFHFKEVARAVKFTSNLFGKALSKRIKATILYATETGKSELFARKLGEIFGHGFNAQVCRMDEYDIVNIEHETLILVVTSTFGNGDPPENGQTFANNLYSIKMNQAFMTGDEYGNHMASSKSFIKMNSQTDAGASYDRKFDRSDSLRGSQLSDIMSDDSSGPLRNLIYAVFGLGSTAYPTFAAFGRYVDNLLGELGGDRLMKLTCGDELAGQDIAFRTWAGEVFKIACESFCLDVEQIEYSSPLTADTISSEFVRLAPRVMSDPEVQALSKLHNRKVMLYTHMSKTDLQQPGASRVTINVVLKKQKDGHNIPYLAGDHVGIMANNKNELVNAILKRLMNPPEDFDKPVQLELMEEKQTPLGVQKNWSSHSRLPCVSLRQLLTRYLDITTPLRPDVLVYLERCTENTDEKETLHRLAHDPDEYEHWRSWHWPDLATVLNMFPSVKPDASILSYLLPVLQPRFYSVSSTPLVYPDELHLTVAVVSFKTKGGDGPLHSGVCSNYLNDIKPGTIVPCFVRSAASFRMPNDLGRPIVMVGPGSGIAPFRGFWQQRKAVIPSDQVGRNKVGRMTLFFGCQTKEMILYRSELEELKRTGILGDIFLALSREPTVKKTYVQDLLLREGENIARQVLKEGGHVYVCGDCTMAEDVFHTLKGIIQEKGHMNDAEVESFMFSLRDDNRYHEDIFGITHRTAEVVEKVRQTALTRIESNYAITQANTPTIVNA